MAVSPMKRRAKVLKLVCPGGAVEVYWKPITAAEVMNRKPQHYVTRPDVFQYPWVVVRPESVLEPGEVFYVVPAWTIYRLLQSKGYHGSHQRNADLQQGDYTFPAWSCFGDHDQYRSKQSDVDTWCMVKRGSNHDCQKTERCNLVEHDRRNVLSDLAAAHLGNVLESENSCRQLSNICGSVESTSNREHEQGKCVTASSLKEVAQSHPRRRQLSLDSSEKRNHCVFKGYDSDSAQLKSKRWSHYKQTSGQNLSGYNSTSSVTTRQCDKGSLKLTSLGSLIAKLPLLRKHKLDSVSKKKISSNAGNPCKDMASDHENVDERQGPAKFYFTGGNAKSEYNEAREYQGENVGSMHSLEQCQEEILSGDTSFTFDVPLRTEADVPHAPQTISYNSIFNYDNRQCEENNSHWLMKLQPPNTCCYKNRISEANQGRKDASTNPISESSCTEYKGHENGSNQGRRFPRERPGSEILLAES